jgi:hypothetical protein
MVASAGLTFKRAVPSVKPDASCAYEATLYLRLHFPVVRLLESNVCTSTHRLEYERYSSLKL